MFRRLPFPKTLKPFLDNRPDFRADNHTHMRDALQ